MKEWWTEASEAARNTAELTDANRLILAYQFERAKAANPQGFTMDLFGGLVHPSRGYAVGMTPISFDSVGDALDTLVAIQEQWGFRNLYLGFWKDEDREYIDVTMITTSWEMAEKLGERMKQPAIYDFSQNDVIILAEYYGDEAA